LVSGKLLELKPTPLWSEAPKSVAEKAMAYSVHAFSLYHYEACLQASEAEFTGVTVTTCAWCIRAFWIGQRILGKVKIHILTTGGTIEKVYSEQSGAVENVAARINQYVAMLRLPDTQIDVTQLMNKDSLDMTDDDRASILHAVRSRLDSPIVITHGTDTMVETGRLLKKELTKPGQPPLIHPVILTGSMTPLGFERSDGLQNLTESLFAARVLAPAVWIVLHNQAFDVDHVHKDRKLSLFIPD
jgi:L-asparaginase